MLSDLETSPCSHQTEADIEEYYRNKPEGSVAVVRHTQGGLLHYEVKTFSARRAKTGRIHVDNRGDFYMKSGKNCYHPTGQTRLVVPTPEVLAWAEQNPQGKWGMGWSVRNLT